MEIRNRKLTTDEFTRQGRPCWPSGPPARTWDLDEALAYQRAIPAAKRFSDKLEGRRPRKTR
jgi:glutamate mutase epsilon subunit